MDPSGTPLLSPERSGSMMFLDSEVEPTGVTGIEIVDGLGVTSKLRVALRRSVVGDATVALLSVFVVDRLWRIAGDIAVS